jgi:hypothetical protein
VSFAFARGFLALGAFVGELRLFGGMVACVPQQSAAFPAAVLSLGLGLDAQRLCLSAVQK